MSKSFNKVNTNIDLSLLTIKTEKEPKKEMVIKINNSIVKMDTFDELDKRNITIKHAIQILNQQWRLNGLRPRTIDSYNYNFKRFVEVTKVEYLHEINNEKIYQYLSSFKNAKDTSLHGRLKQIKAVLSKCHDNGWYNSKFWTNIKIKVNTSVKEATTEKELALLLSLLDKSTYSGLRDSIAILLLYKTGIRIKTLGALREQNIDFENMLLKLQGEIMKSHRPLVLPLDDEMCTLLRELIIVEGELSANSAGSGIVSLEIVSHRIEKPTEELFSFNDVKELLLHGDDSHNNSLVINENGKLLLMEFNIVKEAFYAVRHETFIANNRYVGNKNISDDFIRSVYISMLDGWESHLHSHQSVYVDLHKAADEESLRNNISELIEKI